MKQKGTKKSLESRILDTIKHRGRGSVFFGTEFITMGSPDAVRQAMSRLAKAGTIKRIGTALYHYPVINRKLGGEMPPDADAVAQSIARRTDSRIVASGALAANLLGLSTQVPAKRVYLTDGPSRSITIGAYSLVFRHVAPRRMAAKGKISAMVFEAFRHLKPENVNSGVIERLRKNLPTEAKNQVRKDIKHAAVWMCPFLQQILIRGNNK